MPKRRSKPIDWTERWDLDEFETLLSHSHLLGPKKAKKLRLVLLDLLEEMRMFPSMIDSLTRALRLAHKNAQPLDKACSLLGGSIICLRRDLFTLYSANTSLSNIIRQLPPFKNMTEDEYIDSILLIPKKARLRRCEASNAVEKIRRNRITGKSKGNQRGRGKSKGKSQMGRS